MSITQPTPRPAKKKHRFTLMMVVAMLIVVGLAAGLLEYSNSTLVNITVAGTPHAYFAVFNGSDNVTLPVGSSSVVQVPPHTNITIYAYPQTSYMVTGWNLSGAQRVGAGQNSISIETGPLGENVELAVDLSTNSTAG